MAGYETHEADVLVVGGGIAGAFAAIRASELGARVLLVDRGFFGRSGVSTLASGVFAHYMPGDDREAWLGSHSSPLVNRRVLWEAILQTYDLLMLMDQWGVRWIKEGDRIARAKAAAGLPFPNNAMMAEGGPQMMMALRNEALRRGVQVVNRVIVTDLLTSDGQQPTQGKVVGAIGFDTRSGQAHLFKARATVLCTGPIKFPYPPAGQGFKGMPIAGAGDGVAAAFRAGAQLRKIELAGTGPTSAEFYCAPALEMGTEMGMRFLNALGEDILPETDLADYRRFRLGRAVLRTYGEGKGPVYVDVTHLTPDRLRLFKQVVPIVLTTFERAGYDLTRDRVPYVSVYPLQDGVVGGGMRVSERGASTLPGLYGAGNCTDGAYIGLAQPLHFCAVLGWRAGESAARDSSSALDADEGQARRLAERAFAPLGRESDVRFEHLQEALGALYGREITHIMRGDKLEAALLKVRDLRDRSLPQLSAREPRELAKATSMANFLELLEASLLVVLHRQESRNILRQDFPYTDNESWLNYTLARKGEDGQVVIWDEPVPDSPDYELPAQRKKTLHPVFRR